MPSGLGYSPDLKPRLLETEEAVELGREKEGEIKGDRESDGERERERGKE